MVGGDTCIVRNGTYIDHDSDNRIVHIYSNIPGADAKNPVTFKAENIGGAVLDGKNDLGFGFLLNKTSFVNIVGFEIVRGYCGIKMQQSHDIHIDKCEINNIGRNWVQQLPCDTTAKRSFSGINGTADSFNIKVTNCGISNIGRRHVQPKGTCWRDFLWDHAIYATGKGWSIENSKIWNIHSGWHIVIDGHHGATSSPTHVIRNCEFYDGHGGSAFKKTVYWGQIKVSRAHGNYMPHNFVIENCNFSKPEQDIAINVANYINLKGSVFRNNRTSAGTLYYSGSGSPSLSGNSTNNSSGSASAPESTAQVSVSESPSQTTTNSSSGCYLNSKFKQSTLRNGVAYYTDRIHTIKGGVPAFMVGLTLIKTPNAQRLNNAASGYLRFTNPVNSYVYVLFDSRAANLPDWLDRGGWEKMSNYKITTSMSSQPYLQVWRKKFAAGSCVNLGGNYGPGSSTENRSNFVVAYGQSTNSTSSNYTPISPASPASCDLAPKFRQTQARSGIRYHTDRAYTITGGLPNFMVGRTLIKTPNKSIERLNKAASGYLRFSNSSARNVYVLFDSRASNLPDWIDKGGWVKQSAYKITTSLSTQPYLQVWRKKFPSGACVDLGGNYGPGSSTENRSNYIVIY